MANETNTTVENNTVENNVTENAAENTEAVEAAATETKDQEPEFDYALHAKKIRYQNLLHVTVLYNKYTVKEFFEIVEREGIDIDPDSLVDGTDSTFDTDFDRNLVALAKEKLYPYREMAEKELSPIHAVKPAPEKKRPGITEIIGDTLFAIYDAPRRMQCGMKPFDIEFKLPSFKKDKKKEENPEEEKKGEAVTADVINKDGKVEATAIVNIESAKEEKKMTKVFAPVEGAVSIDTQKDFNEIFAKVKDYIRKDTQISCIYNGKGVAYTVSVVFPDGKTNSFSVDAMNILPDHYSLLVTDEKYGTVAVPFAEKELANHIINTPMYHITPKDTERILRKYYLEDIGLYYMFDFSTLKDMSKLSRKQKKKLSENLLKLSEDLRDKNTGDIPRFRFSKFTSVDEFEITSDYHVKSPLAAINETSSWIANCIFYYKNGQHFSVNGMASQTVTA